MQVRLDKRARIIDEGGQAYPVDLLRDHTLKQIREKYTDEAGELTLEVGEEVPDDVVTIGGRVMFLRNTGKLCFTSLQDGFTESSNGAGPGRLEVRRGPGRLRVGQGIRRPISPRGTLGDGHRVEDGLQGTASPAHPAQGAR